MKNLKSVLIWINLLGGLSVIGSYILGLAAHPGQADLLWGGVPASLRPIITANMPLAALGFLWITYFVIFRLDLRSTRLGRFSAGVLVPLYLLILIPSSLWMELTFAAVSRSSPAGWVMVISVLALVGLAAVGLLAALVSLQPRPGGWAYRLACLAALPFVFQTAVLDALVWTWMTLR